MKRILTLSLLSVLLLGAVACDKKEDPRVIELEKEIIRMEEEQQEREAAEAKAKQEKLEAEKEAKEKELEEADAAEKAQLKIELEEAKAAAQKAAKDAAEAKKKADKAAATPSSKFGPGTKNHLNGYNDGWVSVCTKSANGKLSLRSGPEQSATKITEIPNGTFDIYYFDRHKIGEYVWYQVNYLGNTGYLRGDYLC